MSNLPLVSVLMPVYNCSLFIQASVESILNQSYTNFELLIFDDHSTDNTVELLEAYEDSRITIFKKEKNTGYTNSLIMGITKSVGKYIARMDGDDISDLKRFEKQVNFLEANPGYGIVGSQLKTIIAGSETQLWSFPATDEEIRLYMIVNSPFAHPSVMIRKEVLDKHNLSYNTFFEPCEDYKLWVDLLNVTKGANLDEVLLYYRLHSNQAINIKKNSLINHSNLIRREVVENICKQRLTAEELKIHYYFFNEIGDLNSSSVEIKYQWRKKLLRWFTTPLINEEGKDIVEKYWLKNVRAITEFKPSFIKFLFNRHLIKNISFFEMIKYIGKCISRYNIPSAR